MRSLGRKSGRIAMIAVAGLAFTAGGCSSIKDQRGYVVNRALVDSVHSGIDNKLSVSQTLGRPTFTSQFGEPTWYYVSSRTGQKPFTTPKITDHYVFIVKFDAAGNVISTDSNTLAQVARISPDGDKTPTLGRERSFLEDLFGNIGAVGGLPGAGAPTP